MEGHEKEGGVWSHTDQSPDPSSAIISSVTPNKSLISITGS